MSVKLFNSLKKKKKKYATSSPCDMTQWNYIFVWNNMMGTKWWKDF